VELSDKYIYLLSVTVERAAEHESQGKVQQNKWTRAISGCLLEAQHCIVVMLCNANANL